MSNPIKLDATAIAMELIPVLVHAAGIVAFLYLTKMDSFQTFVAVFLGLIWLKMSSNRMAEDFGAFRLQRHLFSLLGKWINQDDAEEEFDEALAKYQMITGSIENEEYLAVVTAAGIANFVREMVAFFVSCYLIYVTVNIEVGAIL
jgi:hypothetical protein